MRSCYANNAKPAVVLMPRPAHDRGMTPPHPSTTPTTARPNTAQAAAWNGPEAANWAEASTVTAPADADLVGHLLDAARIRPGELVLDVGCGTGDATRAAARAAADVTALGVDLSQLMVDIAVEAAADEGLTNVTFVVGDAQVHPFWQDTFDVVISHFGAMFFDDPVAAFANLAGALRPGGRLAFVVPQAMELCDWYTQPQAALTGARPTPETRPSQMFSLADPDTIDDVLTAAGFADVVATPTPHALWFGADAAAAARFYARSGPVRATIEQTPGLDEARAEELLEQALRPHAGPDGVRLAGEHWLVTAGVSSN
jgi:SAM-dependent methyltransferase